VIAGDHRAGREKNNGNPLKSELFANSQRGLFPPANELSVSRISFSRLAIIIVNEFIATGTRMKIKANAEVTISTTCNHASCAGHERMMANRV
jgi:hypothetical protein